MLKIALDLDDTVFEWRKIHETKFHIKISRTKSEIITQQVNTVKYDKEFWSNLPLLEKPDFTPEVWCTKRINPKSYTREWIVANGFPDRPIYQTIYQYGNKADIIKGRCDVLIDDSFSNVKKCINSGVPAILINRPHNKGVSFEYRVSKLDINEIESVYNQLLNDFPYLRKFTGS